MHALEAQQAGDVVHQRVEREEDRDRKQAEAVHQRVDEIVQAGALVGKRMHRDRRLERAQHQVQRGQFDQADEEPLGAFERFLGKFAEAGDEHERLDRMLEQPALG